MKNSPGPPHDADVGFLSASLHKSQASSFPVFAKRSIYDTPVLFRCNDVRR